MIGRRERRLPHQPAIPVEHQDFQRDGGELAFLARRLKLR